MAHRPASRLFKARQWWNGKVGEVIGMSADDVDCFDEYCAIAIPMVTAAAISLNAVTSLVDGHSIANHIPGNLVASPILGTILARALFSKNPALPSHAPN